jgi:hypothetical protein
MLHRTSRRALLQHCDLHKHEQLSSSIQTKSPNDAQRGLAQWRALGAKTTKTKHPKNKHKTSVPSQTSTFICSLYIQRFLAHHSLIPSKSTAPWRERSPHPRTTAERVLSPSRAIRVSQQVKQAACPGAATLCRRRPPSLRASREE